MTFNKSKLRKVLVLALSLFMIPTQVHAENGSGTDITTKWYSEIVSDMFARGIISDTVGLEEPLTRGNMAEILIATGKFSDNTYEKGNVLFVIVLNGTQFFSERICITYK